MVLLVTICGAVGVFSYVSMDGVLTRQLDQQLGGASHRSSIFGQPVPGTMVGPDPLEARGQSVGTLNARMLNGAVVSAGFLAGDATRRGLSTEDDAVLLALTPDAAPVGRTLSAGAYRLTSVRTPFGDVIVTGLPLAEKQNILASLVWTLVLVSAAGLVLIGLAGTAAIRRTLKPLEQLSEVATKVSRLPLDAGEVTLGVRVPASAAHPGTEVGSVGYALNQMLDNVSNALEARQESELPDEPVVVRGDAAQLHQVIANLLSNARKHTAPGTRVVTGVMRSADGSAMVTVTDNGGGIPPEFLSRVFARFARFARADTARTPVANSAAVHQPDGTAGGTGCMAGTGSAEGTSGLGLSIVQSILEAHGGTVEVSSRPGRTEFAIRLPAAPPARTFTGRAQLVPKDLISASRTVDA